jgi:hypothetical protein
MDLQSNNFTCRKCNAKFNTKMKLTTHESNHDINICDIDSCGYKAANKKDLLNHLKSAHKNGYDTNNVFLKYMSLTKNCKTISRRNCLFCKTIIQTKNMKKHIYIHFLKKDITCNVCTDNISYSYKDYLNHKRTEIREKFFGNIPKTNKSIKCEMCLVYVKDTYIRSHYNNHKNKGVICKYCKDNIIYNYEDFVIHFTNKHELNKIESFVNTYMNQEELKLLNMDKEIKISNSDKEIEMLNKLTSLNSLLVELNIINNHIADKSLNIDTILNTIFFKKSFDNNNTFFINNLNEQLLKYNNIKCNIKSHMNDLIIIFNYILRILYHNKHMLII